MATGNHRNLEAEIERLVRDHLMVQHRAVAAAVERAFAVGAAVLFRAKQPAALSHPQERRDSDEMAGDVTRLYDAVRAHPGETMIFLASELRRTRAALVRPMALLKRGGRVRSAGQRNQMRYFPMSGAKAA